MLLKNILNIRRIVSIILIILTLSSLITLFINNEVKATYSSKFSNYPRIRKTINLQDITVEMLYHQQEQMLGNVLATKL